MATQTKLRASTQIMQGTVTSDLLAPELYNAMTTGVVWKRVKLIATANIDVATGGLAALDGVTPVDGDRILLTAQTAAKENGPWLAHAGAWTRPDDWKAGSTQESTAFYVDEGTANADTKWLAITDKIVVDTTNVTINKDQSGAVIPDPTAPGLTLMTDQANKPVWTELLTETPTGTIDDTNKDFTLATDLDGLPGRDESIQVFLNGQLLWLTDDYTLDYNTTTKVVTVKLVAAPLKAAGSIPADKLIVKYPAIV